MRAMLRLTFLILVCLGFIWQGEAARAEYLVNETGMLFPDRLGPANLWKADRYPQAALGHGIEYRAQGFAGSVYVYDFANKAIPDGITNEAVRAQFAQARNDIFTVQRQRNLSDPQLVGERTLQIGATPFLVATYRYVRNDIASLSLIALTGFRRHFIKVRVSVPDASGQAGIAQMDEFVQGVARVLADAKGR